MEDPLDLRFAALADPTRRAILARLALGQATVAEIGRPFAMSQPAISRHLRVLEQAGLIETRTAAQARPRRLRAEALRELATWIEGFWTDSFDRLDALLGEAPAREEKGHG